MSVFKRHGSPYYYAEFIIEGVRFCRSTKATTERQARNVEKLLKEEARARLAEKRPAATLTLDTAFGRYWIEFANTLSEKWAAQVARYSQEILRILPKDMLIEQITDAEVNDFVQARLAEGGGGYAINRALAVFRRVHNVAAKKWKQKTQIIDWADFMSDEAKRVRFLTTNEIEHLMKYLSPSLKLAVEWSLYTGCRWDETFSLTWNRVFFERGYATVTAKGSREHTVWLTPHALGVLARCDRDRRYVFDKTNWRRAWDAGKKKAGIADFRWHDLRHTHATWLRQQGAPVEVVQRSLGHSDISTTLRYAHVADRELQEALHRLPTLSTNTDGVVSIFTAKSKASGGHGND